MSNPVDISTDTVEWMAQELERDGLPSWAASLRALLAERDALASARPSPTEFADKMNHIEMAYEWDIEVAHAKADDLLCELLDTLGYEEGTNIFHRMKKWYA